MPALSNAAKTMRPSLFASLAERMKALPSDHLPLHIGDTYRLPPEGARLENQSHDPKLYRYSHPFGLPDFLTEIATKLKNKNGIADATADWVQLTCGATQALHCAALTLLNPGDEVLVLAPYWPLIVGILRSTGAVPVQVPFSDRLKPGQDPQELVRPHLTERTRALYFANPNNPDGKAYTRAELESLAAFARQHDLWVLSDEVYEDYLYDGREHVSIASLEGMAERTHTAFSFSKSYALAGHRLGYAVGPPDMTAVLRRVANHTVYNVAATLQQAGLAAMREGAAFLAESRRLYQQARDILHTGLPDQPRPQGGGYFFLPCADAQAAESLLHRALDEALVLAPGQGFGEAYGHCLRICFTSAPPADIERAAEILRRLR